jgi:hypothetical protein
MYNGEKRPLSLLLVFYFISCGFFSFYWMYIVTSEIREVYPNEKINPAFELIVSILSLGLYLVFWSYKYGKFISKAYEKAHLKPHDNSFLYAVLSGIFLFPVTMCLMQNQLNKLWDYGK